MRIEKKDYSRGKWRLVTPNGEDVFWQKPMDHPDLGQTWVTVPVCGETKQECIYETLHLLEILILRRQKGA
jgi:hypothetical protein